MMQRMNDSTREINCQEMFDEVKKVIGFLHQSYREQQPIPGGNNREPIFATDEDYLFYSGMFTGCGATAILRWSLDKLWPTSRLVVQITESLSKRYKTFPRPCLPD
jgi:hypothetical protein